MSSSHNDNDALELELRYIIEHDRTRIPQFFRRLADAKREKNEKQKARIQELDAMLHELDRGLAAKDESIAAKDEIIRRNNDYMYKNSVKCLVETHQQLPRLISNTAALASDLFDASPITTKAFLNDLPGKQFEINFGDPLFTTNCTIDPCGYVTLPAGYHLMNILHDALRCAGIHDCEVCMLRSIFSMHPDVVVVRRTTLVIGVFVVMCPEEDVFTSTDVAGQMFEYLSGLERMGIHYPFACLTTLEEACFAVLVKNRNDATYKSIMELAHTALISREQALRTAAAKQEWFQPHGKDNECDTLPKADLVHCSVDSETGEVSHMQREREIGYSKVFGRETIFTAFLCYLWYGIKSIKSIPPEDDINLIPSEGDSLGGRIAFCIGPDSFQSVHLDVAMKASYAISPCLHDEINQFYLLCLLGMGSSGKAFLAASQTGKIFVVKLYLGEHFYGNSLQDDAEERDEVKAMAEEECERWHILYPELKMYVKVVQLNGFWALTMPYFSPILREQRLDTLDEVHTEMMRVAKLGFEYSEDTLRWWHFGIRIFNGVPRIFCLDLGSLSKIRAKYSDSTAQSMLEKKDWLQERAESDGQSIPQHVMMHP